jgi:hypothetical protein
VPLTLLPLLPLLAAALAAEPDPAPQCQGVGTLAVDALGASGEELERAAQLVGAAPAGPLLIRAGGARVSPLCQGGPFAWSERLTASGQPAPLRVLPVRLTLVENSGYPSGLNDGLLWAGRGLSTSLSGGVAARWRWLSVALAPEVTWQQNLWFETPASARTGDLRFGSPLYGAGIDLPQRFGAGPFASVGPGQSHLRADAFNVAIGVTTENLWLGPGIRNSLLMSDTAPGVPRLFIGTSHPADVWIGKLELLAFWGRLDRTRWFPDSGHPLLTGLALTFEPRWIPGLYVGLARTFVQPGSGLRTRDYFAFLQGPWKSQTEYWAPTGDNPLDNQLASLWARWVFPASALELYGEWGKEDYSGATVNQFFQDPAWTQAWLLGLQKLFRTGGGWLRLQLEATHLQEVRGPGTPSWYTHGENLGYTQAGQLLGAGIGPGGDAQTLAIDWLTGSGRIGGYLERIGRNEGAYWSSVDPVEYWAPGLGHDVEMTAAARQLLFAGPVEVAWEAGVQWRWNRDFLGHEANFRASVQLTWRVDGAAPREEPPSSPPSGPAPGRQGEDRASGTAPSP